MTDPSLARIDRNRSRGRIDTRSLLERVPDTVHRADEPRLVAVLAELAADARDVGVDNPTARVVAVAPDAVHQRVAAQHHAGVTREGQQDLELERREADLGAVDLDAATGGVDHHPVALDRAGGLGGALAAIDP